MQEKQKINFHHKDIAMKRFFRNPVNVKDLIRIVFPEMSDITEDDITYLETEETDGTHRFRDLCCEIRNDTYWFIHGLEPQSYQDDETLVRFWQEDAARAMKLIKDRKRTGRKKIPQIITSVMWLDKRPWTRIRSLRDITEAAVEEVFNDYRLHIIEPYLFDTDDFFSKSEHTAVELLLVFIRAINDVKMMKSLLNDRKLMRSLEKETVQAISAVTEAPIEKYIEEKGECTMETCWSVLIEEQQNIGVEKGLEKGMKDGLQKGREEGLQLGRNSGKKEKSLEICLNMLRKSLSTELIRECTGLSDEEIASVQMSMKA